MGPAGADRNLTLDLKMTFPASRLFRTATMNLVET
jgi:hypothetical protein